MANGKCLRKKTLGKHIVIILLHSVLAPINTVLLEPEAVYGGDAKIMSKLSCKNRNTD